MSTIAVYGRQKQVNVNSPTAPTTNYAKSKLKADNTLITMRDKCFTVSIIRPPMVYGGGDASGNMRRLIELCRRRVPLPFKDINNSREFIHVNNLTQYLDYIVHNRTNGVLLVSDQYPISTENLIRKIFETLEKKPRLFRIPCLLLRAIRLVLPELFNKLYESLTIETNLPIEACKDSYSIDHGLNEMLSRTEFK